MCTYYMYISNKNKIYHFKEFYKYCGNSNKTYCGLNFLIDENIVYLRLILYISVEILSSRQKIHVICILFCFCLSNCGFRYLGNNVSQSGAT